MKYIFGSIFSRRIAPVMWFIAVSCFLTTASAFAQQAAAPAAPAGSTSSPQVVPAAPAATAAAPAAPAISAGDTAWVLASAALVLLMTPGLAFFYGGMVRRKNVMATIMQSFFLVALISVQWVVWGYSLAFAPGNSFWGGLSWLFLDNMPAVNPAAPTIPHYAFMIFQAMFAIITPALICGAYAERVSFKGFVVFSLLWATFVYDPIAHWVWGGGYFKDALDFAGGTVVHMSSGYSALTLALLLGTRKGYGRETMIPHNLTLVLLGASLLWFGWFGFNAGSAGAANALACNAFVTTNTATAMAALTWCLIEFFHHGKATSLGAASGAVAGLVAITPACGFVDLKASLIIGLVVSCLCYTAIQVKVKLGYDDSLDAFGVHGVGGTWGALATGLFALKAVNGTDGLFAGNPAQFFIQLKTVGATILYSVTLTIILYFLVEKTIGFRVKVKEEELGLDLSQHGEEGYNY
jgi:Amt family ammonium transporter